MACLIDRRITEIIGCIGRNNSVEEALLFGSHARGTATAESDVDLLVIVRGTIRPSTRGALSARLTAICTTAGLRLDLYQRSGTEFCKDITDDLPPRIMASAMEDARLLWPEWGGESRYATFARQWRVAHRVRAWFAQGKRYAEIAAEATREDHADEVQAHAYRAALAGVIALLELRGGRAATRDLEATLDQLAEVDTELMSNLWHRHRDDIEILTSKGSSIVSYADAAQQLLDFTGRRTLPMRTRVIPCPETPVD